MTALSEISKRGPRLTPEQKAEQKKNQTQARVGLGSNVLGLTAGAAATGAALKDTRFKHGGKVARGLYSVGRRIPAPIAALNERLGNKGRAALAGGALALQGGNMAGDVVANRVLSRSAAPAPGKVKKALYDESITGIFISKSDHTTGHGSIEKAYRRYDPEADRQRRLGLAAGAGAGGAVLLGGASARHFTTDVTHGGAKVKGIAVRPKGGKKALLLTGGAALSGGLGAAAYKRGLSERNNPWN